MVETLIEGNIDVNVQTTDGVCCFFFVFCFVFFWGVFFFSFVICYLLFVVFVFVFVVFDVFV